MIVSIKELDIEMEITHCKECPYHYQAEPHTINFLFPYCFITEKTITTEDNFPEWCPMER